MSKIALKLTVKKREGKKNYILISVVRGETETQHTSPMKAESMAKLS